MIWGSSILGLSNLSKEMAVKKSVQTLKIRHTESKDLRDGTLSHFLMTLVLATLFIHPKMEPLAIRALSIAKCSILHVLL